MEKNDLKRRALEFLRQQSVMSVAINNPTNPVSTVLLFVVDDDFTFYFATHKDSIKARSLEADRRISLSVWSHDQMMVQASGVVTEVTDKLEIEKTLDKLADTASTIENFWPPVLQMSGHDYVVYSIKVTWLRTLDLSNKTIHAAAPFFQII